MTNIGYCAIVVPAHNLFQGFFLEDWHTNAAKAALTRFRQMHFDKSEVRIDMPDVAEDDQNILGGVCSALVDRVLAKDLLRIAVLIRCTSLLINSNYFWIKGNVLESGTETTITKFSATSVEDARNFIRDVPEVIEIKNKLGLT